MNAAQLPPAMAEIVDIFTSSPPRDRLELLLEYSEGLPKLPERYVAHPELLEQVPECQSRLFAAVEIDDSGKVELFFDAPLESPTTRGFAGILHTGLNGLPAEQVLNVPVDLSADLGLAEVVSPLRVRGAVALLSRVQRQIRRHLDADAARELAAEGQPNSLSVASSGTPSK
jgi:cysteine desulfuration protein SufE